MKLLQGFALALTLGAVVAMAAPAAAVDLDTPSMTFQTNSPSYVELTIQAGLSGTPNGFTVEWMSKSDYDANGWPTDYLAPGYRYCTFNGVPSFIVTPGIADFLLGSNATVRIRIGELFDETGCDYFGPWTPYTDELDSGTLYVMRVRAEGGPGGNTSPNSATQINGSGTHEVCRFTQGYWKNHPEAWPSGCTPMLLGTNLYTQTQLLAILGTPSSTGPCGTANGLLILVHQLIAAKLNACLSSPPPSIAAAIAAADAMIGNKVPPPYGTGCIPPDTASPLATQLDDFNNGKTSGDSCVTPVNATTWGRLKTLYR